MIQPCPSWLWVCTRCCSQGPAVGALGQKFGQGQLVPFLSAAVPLGPGCPSPRGCPWQGLPCAPAASPTLLLPARLRVGPAARAAWEESCCTAAPGTLPEGGRLCLQPRSRPGQGCSRESSGGWGRWQEQGLKAAEQPPPCSRHQERPPRAPH